MQIKKGVLLNEDPLFPVFDKLSPSKNQFIDNYQFTFFYLLFWVSQSQFGLNLSMFVRQKKNKSGVISIQVIDKSSGKYKVLIPTANMF